jgi:hypothetical protein
MKYQNLGNALKASFPEYEWELGRFSVTRKKSMQAWYEKEKAGWRKACGSLYTRSSWNEA